MTQLRRNIAKRNTTQLSWDGESNILGIYWEIYKLLLHNIMTSCMQVTTILDCIICQTVLFKICYVADGG